MASKIIKKKDGEHFRFALFLVFVAISVSILAFLSEDSGITGQATATTLSQDALSDLIEFQDINELGTLAAGKYYIDGNGIVYWTGGNEMTKIAKIKYVDSSQIGRHVYVDFEGNVGFLIG